jgi:predicted N-acetyltransferase YhbS
MEIKFSTEKKADHIQVFRLNQIVFERDNEAKLVNALRQNEKAFIPELSILAKTDAKLIGYVLLTKIFITNSKGTVFQSLTLAPLSVHPKYQKEGVGTQLIRHALAKAKMMGYSSVMVLGHAEFYNNFGFTPCYHWGIKVPFEVPDDALMALELTKHGLQGVQGTISYPKEFDNI